MSLIKPDGTQLVDLVVPENLRSEKIEEAKSLAKLTIDDYSIEWLHVLSEGWASPLRGFMREDQFLQALHFGSLKSESGLVNMSIPITLDLNSENYNRLQNEEKITLLSKNDKPIAIMREIEFYPHQKEERVARTFGTTHRGHPSVDRIMSMGDYLVGGELEVLEPISYNDGLDHYRLSPAELRSEFQKREADAVYAFQLRNPVHNGHALLMNETKNRLKNENGYKNPILLLHPLGGWTKADDVPLAVRIRQHQAVLDEEILDARSTVVAIFPSPMLYAGPTEVQWHAKARINAGADHYIVGRDPAGMPHPETGDSLYNPFHGMKVLQMATGLDRLKIIPFKFAAYDKVAEKMDFFDPKRAKDFLMVSGSKMREYARNGEDPPRGFMGEKAWKVLAEHYAG